MGIEAQINVKRNGTGLIVTVDAPKLAKFVLEYCKAQNATTAAMKPLGDIYPPIGVTGGGKAARAVSFILKFRSSDPPFVDDAEEQVNLFFLRAKAATEGPIVWTFPGLYSAEYAARYIKYVTQAIETAYRELTGNFDKTVIIRTPDVGTLPANPTEGVESPNQRAIDADSLAETPF